MLSHVLRSNNELKSQKIWSRAFQGFPEIQEDSQLFGCLWREKIGRAAIEMALSVNPAISRFTKTPILLRQHIAKSHVERTCKSLMLDVHAVPVQNRLTYYRPD